MKQAKLSAKFNNYLFLLVLGLGFLAFSAPQPVAAATLYYSPAQGSYEVGKSFTITIYAGSADQPLNAFTGTVDFPANLLQVSSISKSGSVANLWIQEPSFSNANGTVSFSGLVLNPGFKGASGKVLSITFKAKAAGTANLRFTSGEILANDGQGTNILQGLGSAQIKVTAVVEAAKPAPVITTTAPATPVTTAPEKTAVKAGTPSAPVIASVTHPDPIAWYQDRNPKFIWGLPTDVTAVRVLYDKSPSSEPSVVYQPPVSGKDLSDVSDGSYYFHAQFKNAQGWGPVSHFGFQIDTASPVAFNVKFPHREDSSNPRPVVLFNTTDELSGIDYYEVKVGDGQVFKVTPGEIVESNPYVLPVQRPGQHAVIVRAVDKAGNSSSASEIFNIEALDAPTLDYFSNELTEGDILKVSGSTYPSATVMIFVKDESGLVSSDHVTSGASGGFTLIWSKRLPIGSYSLWSQVTDKDGAKSVITTPTSFIVKQPFLEKLTGVVLDYLSVVILIAFFILGLLFLAWYGWHKFLVLKKKVRREVRDVEKSIMPIFDHLQRDIEQQIRILEKVKTRRDLTREEKRVITILKRDLIAAKKVLSREIDDINEEVD